MESASKTRVSQAVAQQIVQRAFGENALLRDFIELHEGYFSAAYRLGLDDGRCFVLKVSPPRDVRVLRYEYDVISAEVTVMRLVRQQTKLPVAEVLAFDTSCELVASPYMLVSFLPGQSLSSLGDQVSASEREAIDRELGDYMRQLHAITGDSFGLAHPQAQRFSTWREAFLNLFELILLDGEEKDIPLPNSYAQIRILLQRVAPVLDNVSTSSLVHWDMWDGNIFVDDQYQHITGLIDFERAMWGDPLIENQYIRLSEPAAYLQGYGKSLFVDQQARDRRLLYNLYLFSILIIEAVYRQYPSAGPEVWARSQWYAQFKELAERYLM